MSKPLPKPNIIRSSGGQLAVRMDMPISSVQRKRIQDLLTQTFNSIEQDIVKSISGVVGREMVKR